MKLLWLILSAVDAGFGFEGFATGHYGMGLWLSVLASWAMLFAVYTEDKTDDAR